MEGVKINGPVYKFAEEEFLKPSFSQGGKQNISAASGKQLPLVAITTLQPAGYDQSVCLPVCYTFETHNYNHDVIMSQIISF